MNFLKNYDKLKKKDDKDGTIKFKDEHARKIWRKFNRKKLHN